ncbi:hypothetical protein E3N88_30201 [Mikania micrantha]|uniref:Protein FAR1-RELATED SEQUENCE n=1 Tax=Mikania micrantha TaxID=192012 RepID=A0A5N6MLI7_9ASTR|nr:hypothetical protein E3N88_30201 [Mikania micrantha]
MDLSLIAETDASNNNDVCGMDSRNHHKPKNPIDDLNENQIQQPNIFYKEDANYLHVQNQVDNIDEDSVCSTLDESPNGTRYWTPIVHGDIRPIIGSVFDRWDDVINIRSNFKVTDCKARIKLRVIKESSKYELYDFVEKHNHGLINADNLDLSRKRRKLNFADQEYITKCRLANVGPNKAHRLQVALKGGHHMVRGTKTDFKNFGRDVYNYIGNRDAQMFVDRMSERSQHLTNHTFEFHTLKASNAQLCQCGPCGLCDLRWASTML